MRKTRRTDRMQESGSAAGLRHRPGGATRPPYDADLLGPIAAILSRVPSSSSERFFVELREMATAGRVDDETLRCGGQVNFEELSVPGPSAGSTIELLFLRPSDGRSTPEPAVYYAHSGGMVAGNNRTSIGVALDLVLRLGVCVISVEYRLAPEHPHPAAVDDAYAGLCWVSANAKQLRIDSDRLVLAGASAGGGLAAAVALMARDRHGPVCAGQMLISPMLDDRNTTASSYEIDGGGTWDRTANLKAWAAVLGDARGAHDVFAYAAPARASDLTRLPPALVDVGSVEIFRDEVVDYAARLCRAGNAAELHVWSGGFHGFDWTVPDSAIARRAKDARIQWLSRLLGLEPRCRRDG